MTIVQSRAVVGTQQQTNYDYERDRFLTKNKFAVAANKS